MFKTSIHKHRLPPLYPYRIPSSKYGALSKKTRGVPNESNSVLANLTQLHTRKFEWQRKNKVRFTDMFIESLNVSTLYRHKPLL